MIKRMQILRSELKYDWNELNLVYKSIVVIGGLLLLAIIYFAIIGTYYCQMSKNIEVIFRSSLSLVFGFILSSNIKNSNKKNIRNKSLIKKVDTENEDSKTCKINYSYREGNYVQIFIILIVIVVSAIMILFIYRNSIFVDIAILAQFRDLMCISIGFLFGESQVRLQ